MALLELQNLSCGYGETIAVRDLSFTVDAGEFPALLGPNGAGKTSTILAIMGHVQIKAGILASGRSVFTGSAESARRDVDLQHSYIGVAA